MKKNKHLYEYPVDVDVYTSHSERSDEPYGPWSESNDVSVAQVNVLNETSKVFSNSAVSAHKFALGETAYLVFLTVNTGDSFGHATNASFQCVHLFENIDLAMMAAQHIELDYAVKDYAFNSGTKNANTISFLNDKMEYQEFYTYEYKGYFESLNNLWVIKAGVGSPKCETIYDGNLSKYRNNGDENKINARKLEQIVQGYQAIKERIKLGEELPLGEKAGVIPYKI